MRGIQAAMKAERPTSEWTGLRIARIRVLNEACESILEEPLRNVLFKVHTAALFEEAPAQFDLGWVQELKSREEQLRAVNCDQGPLGFVLPV
jgi:hypothetical protein